jgi:SAM-dependent methyltransferase
MTSEGVTRVRGRVRDAIPARWRRALREFLTEAPLRARDAIPDALDKFRMHPLPPAALRRRVSLTSSRAEFEDAGRLVAADLLRAFDSTRRAEEEYPRWLDFGCGAGRVARHVEMAAAVRELHGVDVDRGAVAWLASKSIPGRFGSIAPDPPTAFPDASFDVVYAISVFSHFDERISDAWVAELARLLRPGGLLIASTLSPNLTWTRPDLTEEGHRRLQRDGFLYAPGSGPFNENGAFVSRQRLLTRWSGAGALEPRAFEEHGLAGYQDLSVWEKRAVR